MYINDYFESIKHDKDKLRQFVADMPKGGDLHNHLTGSAYAETYFDIACQKGMFADINTGKLYENYPDIMPDNAKMVHLYPDMPDLHNVRCTLIDKWSIRNFQPYKCALGSDEYFFSEFGIFGAAASQKYLYSILHELVVRAKVENLQYLEIMGISPTVSSSTAYFSNDDYNNYTAKILDACNGYNADPNGKNDSLDKTIDEIVKKYDDFLNNKTAPDLVKDIDQYTNDNYSLYHEGLSPDGDFITRKYDPVIVSADDVAVRFQGYVSRNKEPLIVLAQLYIISKSMEKDNLKDILVGCNIVAAENSENSMLYYKAHMRMFNYFISNQRIKKVSMHAGELTMGLIRPEHLTYHISDVVNMGNVMRIGHGVDIVFEHNSSDIIEKMKTNNTAVEINLTSNEFILGVRDDSHPFRLYYDSGVPVVISTDDPGILRTSITDEYVKAIYRYDLSYDDVKKIVMNSIDYSFLDDTAKDKVKDAYNAQLTVFEQKYSNPQTSKTITLDGFIPDMLLHWEITSQCCDGHTIKLSNADGSNVYFEAKKEQSQSSEFNVVLSGSAAVKDKKLVITLDKECNYIVSSSEMKDEKGALKGIVHSLYIEDQDDYDYNDICIQLSSWIYKN